MEDKKNSLGEEKFVDDAGTAVNAGSESKFSWGLLILIGGCIWAVLELIDSVLFFF